MIDCRVPVAATLLGMSLQTFGLAVDAGDWEKMRLANPRGYVCFQATAAPKIDGRIDEDVWAKVPWTETFVDIEGDARPKPGLKTRAKMLWDNEHFYIAAELEEPHVWATLTNHDSVIFQDNDFEVFIDPDRDNHEYYELELNALNTTWDLFLTKPYKDGGIADNTWEITGLRTAVHVDGSLNNATDKDNGWSVEIAIPWAALKKYAHRSTPPQSGDLWNIDFSRVQWRHEIVDGKYRKVPKTREDNWVWSAPGIIDMHRPERWGLVQFSTAAPTGAPAAALNAPVDTGARVVDPHAAGRDALMQIYHRQRSFQKENGKWAVSLNDLAFEASDPRIAQQIQLQLTENGFEATWMAPADNGKRPDRFRVQQDSRLWRVGTDEAVLAALEQAGANRPQLQQALESIDAAQLDAMEFLVANMPARDLKSLTADFLLDNVRLAYVARDESPWGKSVPKEIFFNNVLPYANINERRDSWRKDFRDRFLPLIKGAQSASQAAVMLNQKVFPLTKVKYSRGRNKADQSPYESMESGLASCTGLSVLLIDACRAVGVPARFVGTPLWSDRSGNHSWLEIWDNGWHFTGACEPAGDELNKAWFVDRASTAQRDVPLNAIYAVSFQKTPIHFPLVWDRSIDYVSAVNVTDRYVERARKPPEGTVRALFRVLEAGSGKRISASIRILDELDKELFKGISNDERFDGNDHVQAYLPVGKEYRAEVEFGEKGKSQKFRIQQSDQTITITLPAE